MINTPRPPTIRSWRRADVSILAVHVSNLLAGWVRGGGGIDSVGLDVSSVTMIPVDESLAANLCHIQSVFGWRRKLSHSA
jgi:hypothetical protein